MFFVNEAALMVVVVAFAVARRIVPFVIILSEVRLSPFQLHGKLHSANSDSLAIYNFSGRSDS